MDIYRAIDVLVKAIKTDVGADDVLKYTQAALNLANTLRCIG